MFDNKFSLIDNVSLEFGTNRQGSVMEITGNGNAWAKVTNGSVTVKDVPGRTTVKVTGPGAWLINGDETIG